jgi:hypothetical protein
MEEEQGSMTTGGRDKWSAWLLHRRDGDDPEQKQKALEHLLPIRERVRRTSAGLFMGTAVAVFGAVYQVNLMLAGVFRRMRTFQGSTRFRPKESS